MKNIREAMRIAARIREYRYWPGISGETCGGRRTPNEPHGTCKVKINVSGGGHMWECPRCGCMNATDIKYRSMTHEKPDYGPTLMTIHLASKILMDEEAGIARSICWNPSQLKHDGFLAESQKIISPTMPIRKPWMLWMTSRHASWTPRQVVDAVFCAMALRIVPDQRIYVGYVGVIVDGEKYNVLPSYIRWHVMSKNLKIQGFDGVFNAEECKLMPMHEKPDYGPPAKVVRKVHAFLLDTAFNDPCSHHDWKKPQHRSALAPSQWKNYKRSSPRHVAA